MAQFDLDRIFNNAENQSQKKKKKYDIDRILNSAEDISTRNTTMGTIPAITGSAIQATNKIIAPMAKTTTNLTEADLRKIEQNSGLKTGTLNLNKMQAQQQKFENLQQKGNEILQDKNNKINPFFNLKCPIINRKPQIHFRIPVLIRSGSVNRQLPDVPVQSRIHTPSRYLTTRTSAGIHADRHRQTDTG